MKKKLTFTEKLEKVTKFFNISKTYKSKEKFPSTNKLTRCLQNNRQVIIGKKTAKNRKKTKKIKKNSSNFRNFLSYFSTK